MNADNVTTTALVEPAKKLDPSEVEKVLLKGDLSSLTPAERTNYYIAVCQSVGLNPLTRPFEYLMLNNRLTLYARKDATDQLRRINGISIRVIGRELFDDIYVVTVEASDKTGRGDSDIGAVPIGSLKGEARANAMMKATTKAKRRVTLSISGLGFLDETEIETIPGARQIPAEEVERTPTAVVAETINVGDPIGEALPLDLDDALIERINQTSAILEENESSMTIGELASLVIGNDIGYETERQMIDAMIGYPEKLPRSFKFQHDQKVSPGGLRLFYAHLVRHLYGELPDADVLEGTVEEEAV